MSREIVDLRQYRQPIQTFLPTALEGFSRCHSAVQVSCAALFVFPYDSAATICFDTESSSDTFVAKWAPKGDQYYGEDEYGRFKNNPPDFEYVNFSVLTFETFPKLYDGPDTLSFVDSDGKITNVDRVKEGDEGINRAMFPSLCRFVRDIDSWSSLSRAKVFRAGVVMRDSDCITFWRVPD